jgi:uncharacterized protein (TIGR02996 family)
MTDEGFIRSIQEDPSDDSARLVYADWLEERGDVRAEYLRAELALARLPAGAPEAPALRSRLWRAWGAVEPAWLAVFTQPRLLRANPTPFPGAWWGTDLGRYRPCGSTYCTWPYESLPALPVDQFRGEFQWLPLAPAGRTGRARSGAGATARQGLQRLETAVTGQGLRLPDSFRRFLAAGELQSAIPSVTDCFFEMPEQPYPDEAGGGGFDLTFFCDSQDVLLWSLYLHPSGGHCVVAREPEPIDLSEDLDDEDDDETDDEPKADTGPRAWFVAPSFESFVYRVWMETYLWYFAHADFLRQQGRRVPSLTPSMQAYLTHYGWKPEAPG